MGLPKIKQNAIKAIDSYNKQVENEDKISLNKLFHGMEHIFNYGINRIDEITEQITHDMNRMLISNGIKKNTNNIIIEDQYIDEDDYCEDEFDESLLFIVEKEMTYKYLRKNIEKRNFNEIFDKANNHEKAVMLANRGLKAMAFTNMPIGTLITDDYILPNGDWDIITKIRLHKPIISPDDKQLCKRCKIPMDPYGIHAWECTEGYNQIAHHDNVNLWIKNEQSKDLVIEYEPTVINEDQSMKRPDLIWHSYIDINGKQVKIVGDTVITNIFNKTNINNIKNERYKIFGAGMLGIKRKEDMYASNRCQELFDVRYMFAALGYENFGAVPRILVDISNDWLSIVANNSNMNNKKLSILKNNYWIRFSVMWNKCMVKRIRDHYHI